MSFHQYVKHIARICNQRVYLLQQMRKQGLNIDCLNILFYAIILVKFCMLCLHEVFASMKIM